MGKFLPQERAAAKAAGEKTYFTGRPCKNGHLVGRLTINGACFECTKASQKRTAQKKFAKNPLIYKERYAKNSELYKAKAAEYRKNNPEKVAEFGKKWAAKNKHKKAFYERSRQAAKLQRTPPWLTKEHETLIAQFYEEARRLSDLSGVNVQVDHIVPLQGETVSGLHVPWNLVLITQSENARKHNKLVEFPWDTTSGGVLYGESVLPWNLRKEVKNGNLANY